MLSEIQNRSATNSLSGVFSPRREKATSGINGETQKSDLVSVAPSNCFLISAFRQMWPGFLLILASVVFPKERTVCNATISGQSWCLLPVTKWQIQMPCRTRMDMFGASDHFRICLNLELVCPSSEPSFRCHQCHLHHYSAKNAGWFKSTLAFLLKRGARDSDWKWSVLLNKLFCFCCVV